MAAVVVRGGLLSRRRASRFGRFGFAASRMTGARWMVVPSVREPMQQRTREQQEPGKRAPKVGSVLLPQKEQRYHGEDRKSPTQTLVIDRALVPCLGQLVPFHADGGLQGRCHQPSSRLGVNQAPNRAHPADSSTMRAVLARRQPSVWISQPLWVVSCLQRFPAGGTR